jgi:serine/threonine protein kinase/tetratricopeptide (TPR) repeat protein
VTLGPGSRLGPYEILTLIGSGGMGEVYRARDPPLSRDVAVKVLPAEFGADPDRVRRFEQEARAAAALNHPNILAVHDIGTHHGSPYIVSELLDGETLRERVARGALPVRKAVEVASQLVRGLAAAHERGIVHRDLKPDNVFVTRDGRVKILDFGLAKPAPVGAAAADVTRAPQTLEGTVLGTIGYMAPEQLRGEPVDARADIFAVGVILHELITGQTPFHRGSAADTMSAVLHEEPPDLAGQPGTPAPLARIVRRCLEKDPINRFQSARDLGFAFETIADAASAPPSKTEVEDRSIGVLPFANMSADPDSQYFSDGLADELINALTHLPGLRVASRTSAFRFRGRDVDIKEIGRALGVANVLEGSVRRTGQRLRVTAQLVNVSDGYHRWSERYDREMADVFEIQDDIVASILRALAPTLLAEAKAIVKRPTENLEAYEWYLKGRQHWYQRSPALMPIAIRSFEQAIALDPDYTLAYAGLADCHIILRINGGVSDATSRSPAKAALTRALALDPMLPEVQFSQGLFILNFERAWLEAEPYFRRAIELNPRSSLAHAYYGLFLAAAYRYEEAAAQVTVALDLDPLSPFVHAIASLAHHMGGAFPEAEQLARRALDLQPDYLLGLIRLALVLTFSGRASEAIPVAERVVALSRAPTFVGMLGAVYGRAGRINDLTRLEHELDERRSRGEYVTPMSLVSFAMGRGDKGLIQGALEDCLTDRMPFVSVRLGFPLLDEWRADGAIDELLLRLGDGVRPPNTVKIRT